MKGISPLIAAVLLIAFTVAVGGIIATWLTSFSKTTTAGVESSTKGATGCAEAYIDVVSVSASSVLVKNPTSNKIYITGVYDNRGTTATLSESLTSGEVKPLSFTKDPTATKITVVGLCEYSNTNVSISGSCESGEDCWS